MGRDFYKQAFAVYKKESGDPQIQYGYCGGGWDRKMKLSANHRDKYFNLVYRTLTRLYRTPHDVANSDREKLYDWKDA
jgi:hypothetical protein